MSAILRLVLRVELPLWWIFLAYTKALGISCCNYYPMISMLTLILKSFMGDGFDQREFDGRDITNYLGSLDGTDRQPNFDKELVNKLAGWAVGL